MRSVRLENARSDLGKRNEPSLAAKLEKLIAPGPITGSAERRKAKRVAIPLLIRVTPLDRQEGTPVGPTITAVGKDLGKSGIGFFHQTALPHKLVRIGFDDPQLKDISVEVELNWCRFSNLGWYESGGKLLRMIEADSLASLAG